MTRTKLFDTVGSHIRKRLPSASSINQTRLSRNRALITVALVLSLLAFGPAVLPGLLAQGVLSRWLLYSILATSFYFVFGLGGQFAFSHAAFFGLGAYISILLVDDHQQTFIIGTLGVMCIAFIGAALFKYLIRAADEFYFAIATLGASEVILGILTQNGGERFALTPPSIGGFEFVSDTAIYWLFLGGLGLTLILSCLIESSPFKRDIIAARDEGAVAAMMGVPVLRVNIVLFALGSAIAAGVGSLYVHSTGIASPSSFGPDFAIAIFLMLMVGGPRSMWGGTLGAAFYVFAPDVLGGFEQYQQVVYGVLLAVVVITLPLGLAGLKRYALALPELLRKTGRSAGISHVRD